MNQEWETVTGDQLRVGDVIRIWWKPHKDVINTLSPYEGKLSYLFKKGASLATFGITSLGMTIDHNDTYERQKEHK